MTTQAFLFLYRFLFIGLLFLAACDTGAEKRQDETWTKDEKAAFIKNCQMNSEDYPKVDADDYCNCVVKKMEGKYSPRELAALPMGEITEVMSEFGRGCLKEQGLDISDIESSSTDTTTR